VRPGAHIIPGDRETQPRRGRAFNLCSLEVVRSARLSVTGSDAILDTTGFRYLLTRPFGVDARSVCAYLIGERGDSEVPVWLLSIIAGMHRREFAVHKAGPTIARAWPISSDPRCCLSDP
jgi:hypothetical protein